MSLALAPSQVPEAPRLTGLVRAVQGVLRDPRHFQILALSSLLTLAFTWSDFGPQPLAPLFALAGALGTQLVGARLVGLTRLDLRSPLITALGLSILLRAQPVWDLPVWHFVAGVVAIGLKFLVRVDGRHIFNPANIGVVALLLLGDLTGSGFAWIQPAQFGTGTMFWVLWLILLFGTLTVGRAVRVDMALMFFVAFAATLYARHVLYLGDPVEIVWLKLQSGALLVFTFHMITDPFTTPKSRVARALFAVMVAALAWWLTALYQLTADGLLISLALCSLTVPLLNRLLPGDEYQWGRGNLARAAPTPAPTPAPTAAPIASPTPA